MKRCNTCNIEKPLTEYYKLRLARDGYEPRCKSCKIESAKLRRRAWKLQAIESKGNRCNMCGNSYPPCVYDFHHANGDKDFSPGDANSKASFFKEIEKCEMLCANCHRIVHHT